MKILIISGFLGAGKTTFIKEFSKRVNRKTAILENEYASINVDQDILKVDSGLSVWESTENCICCSGKSDFAMDVLTISNTIDPEFLIVEPTGVGFLSNVIENIKNIEYERITQLSPITVIDPVSFHTGLSSYGDLYRDHIRFAGTVILSRCDLHPDRDQVEETVRGISSINPGAEIISSDYHCLPDSFYNSLLTRLPGGDIIPDNGADPVKEQSFESISILNACLSEPGELVFLLEEMIRFKYGHVVRAKGTVRVGKKLLRADITDGQYLITEAEEGSKQGFVVIGESLDSSSLRMKLTFTI